MSRTSALLRFAMFAILLVGTVGCTREERPDAAAWQRSWDAIVATVPDPDALGNPPDETLCQSTLAELRIENDDLLPSPSATVDGLATEWVTIAQAAFFDCPPEGEEIDSFDTAYAAMASLEEAVAIALADGS